jgi:hypothetical protein
MMELFGLSFLKQRRVSKISEVGVVFLKWITYVVQDTVQVVSWYPGIDDVCDERTKNNHKKRNLNNLRLWPSHYWKDDREIKQSFET